MCLIVPLFLFYKVIGLFRAKKIPDTMSGNTIPPGQVRPGFECDHIPIFPAGIKKPPTPCRGLEILLIANIRLTMFALIRGLFF
jgi:hypothetical protein